MRRPDRWATPLCVALALTLPACKAEGPATTGAPSPAAAPRPPAGSPVAEQPLPDGVLATVNGVAITEADVEHAMRARARKHGEAVDPRVRAGVLETLIRQEAAAQRAVALGLDRGEEYQAELRRLEAAARAYRREGLQGALYAKEVDERARFGDEELRAFYDANAARVGAELHVWQILARSEEDIAGVAKRLEAGEEFEAVAASRLPALPEGAPKPWDLGFLRWKQVPEPWRDVVYDLAPGAVSGVIRGTGGRFWIVKVLERRPVEDASFEALKGELAQDLAANRRLEARAALDRELLEGAAIIRHEAPPAPAR